MLLIYSSPQPSTTSSSIKVAVILAFIGVGAFFVNPDNWHPFIPAYRGREPVRLGGIIRATTVVFFAYIGFEAVSTAGRGAQSAWTCLSASWAR
jgi:APA family basic amino acid/polyamine antiporter